MEFLISSSENEKKQVAKLWKYCFDDTDEYIEYYFKKRYDFENNYIIKDEDRVLCSLTANKYNLEINKKEKKVSYIVGVSSSAVHRGTGYASILIKRTLEDLYENGEDVAMLMPIDSKIYTRYGFANIYDMVELDVPLDRIDTKKTGLKAKFCEDKSAIPHLIEIYDKCMSNIGGRFVRDIVYFQNMIDEVKLEDGHVIICYDYDKPISYMVFFPKYEKGQRGFVREIFSVNQAGYDKLMEIVKSHFTQMKNVTVHTFDKSDIFYYFNADNKINYKIRPFMMSRALNVSKCLKDLIEVNLNSKDMSCDFRSENLKIMVVDRIIEDNNNVFEIRGDLSGIFALEVSDSKEDFKMDVYDFTTLMFGYMDAKSFLFHREISLEESKASLLKALFPRKTTYFNDYV